MQLEAEAPGVVSGFDDSDADAVGLTEGSLEEDSVREVEDSVCEVE